MIRLRAPRGIRSRLLLAVAAVVFVALAIMTTTFGVLLEQTLEADADDLARGRATSALTTVEVVGGRIVVGETPDDAAGDSRTWIFDAQGAAIEAPPSDKATHDAAAALAGGPARIVDVPGRETRLAALPIVEDGQRVGTLVASVNLAGYERSERLLVIASIALAAVLFVFIVVAARFMLRRALQPVSEMTHMASDWSEHDLGRRFAAGPPYDELTELAAGLDTMLDRIEASMRREQRFSAELSHELRTPLARIAAETELALSRHRSPDAYRAALEAIRRSALDLGRTVDTLVAAARYESDGARGRADAAAVVEAAIAAAEPLAESHAMRIDFEPPGRPVAIGVDADLAERILQPILENACRYGTKVIDVSLARADGSRVVARVADDGPGLAADELDAVFEPGVRGTASTAYEGGAGLGLALARRLARAAGGDVRSESPSPGRGGSFVVELPSA